MQQETESLALLRLSDLAGGFAAMAGEGRARSHFERLSSDYLSQALNLEFGPLDPETAAMSDGELYAALIA